MAIPKIIFILIIFNMETIQQEEQINWIKDKADIDISGLIKIIQSMINEVNN